MKNKLKSLECVVTIIQYNIIIFGYVKKCIRISTRSSDNLLGMSKTGSEKFEIFLPAA